MIGCLGLAFKANVDDLRGSPAASIAERIGAEGLGELLVCEPHLSSHDRFALVGLAELLERSDIVVLLVDHDAFSGLAAADFAGKVLIDTRGMVR